MKRFLSAMLLTGSTRTPSAPRLRGGVSCSGARPWSKRAILSCPLVQPISLVWPSAHRLNRPIDEVVVLQRPRDLASCVSQAPRSQQRIEVENRVNAAASKSLLDAQGDQAQALNLSGREQKPNQPDRDSKGGQSASSRRKRDVGVREGHREGGGLTANLGDQQQLWDHQRPHVLGNVIELFVC